MSRQLQQKKNYPRYKSWKHLIYKIKNQKKCNSCYIASTFSAIEIMHAKKYKEYINLAMQEIIDCCNENMHCKGGQPSNVADYVMKYGISTEENYPYQAKKRYCRAKYYYNKIRDKSKGRILEQLLSEQRKEEESKERVLQSSGTYNNIKYVVKYDDAKGKFYYKLTYPNGKIRYIDLHFKPFTPSHIFSNSSKKSSRSIII